MTSEYNISLSFNNDTPVKTAYTFKQGDKGITLNIATSGLATSGTTAHIVFKRSNGTSVEAELANQSGPNYSYVTLGNEFAVPGVVVADLKLYDGDTQRVSTASFIFHVIGDTLDGIGGGTAGYSDTLEQIKEQLEEASDDLDEGIQEFEDTLQEYKDKFGEVGPVNPRGDYDADEDYALFDLVSYQGSCYLCREDCKGETPSSNSSYWQLYAEGSKEAWLPSVADDGTISWTRSTSQTAPMTRNIKGPKGDTGATGAQGPAGINGTDGTDGLGIKSVDINVQNHLIITYDDDTTHDAGVVPGGSSRAQDVTYDNTNSDLAATNAQSAIDENARHIFFAINNFVAKNTVFNVDGSITETDAAGHIHNIVFTSTTIITETLKDSNNTLLATKTTTFNNDGSITEAITLPT